MNKIGSFSYPKMSDFAFKSSKSNTDKTPYIPDYEQDIVQISKTEKPSEIHKPRRGVNFDNLDPEKTYIGMQYGRRHKLARQIVRFTKKYCPDADVPAHVFALSFKDGEWWVHESHIITKK
nr:hypothetical protein [Cyanobacteria bacterium RUI128]